MNVQARRDIAWWMENVTNHNGKCMFPLPWVTANTIELWLDASDIGAGATFGNQWLCILFTGDKTYFKQFPIAWRELYIVVVMLKTWCKNLTNNRFTLHINNQVIVHVINNGVCKNDDIMELIKELYSIIPEQYGISLHIHRKLSQCYSRCIVQARFQHTLLF